jgi:D-glycero-D-manno-heptose 1,7-bisphosphate phosphatase
MPDRGRAAVFLDRDGTLMEDVGYPSSPDSVELLPGATEALRTLREAGFALVLVSNQSGVARGLIAPDEAKAVHERLIAELGAREARLDGSYYCFHGPDEGCDCRKPAPGLLLRAASELGLDLTRSALVGDKASDAEAGSAAGCTTVMLDRSGQAGAGGADHVARDWQAAARFILEQMGRDGSS